MRLIELREYKIKPGKTQQWVEWMQEELLPYQRSKGMKILNTNLYRDENGVDYFIWLREFDDEQHRQSIYQATYNDWWIEEVRPKVFTLIDEESIRVRQLTSLDI